MPESLIKHAVSVSKIKAANFNFVPRRGCVIRYARDRDWRDVDRAERAVWAKILRKTPDLRHLRVDDASADVLEQPNKVIVIDYLKIGDFSPKYLNQELLLDATPQRKREWFCEYLIAIQMGRWVFALEKPCYSEDYANAQVKETRATRALPGTDATASPFPSFEAVPNQDTASINYVSVVAFHGEHKYVLVDKWISLARMETLGAELQTAWMNFATSYFWPHVRPKSFEKLRTIHRYFTRQMQKYRRERHASRAHTDASNDNSDDTIAQSLQSAQSTGTHNLDFVWQLVPLDEMLIPLTKHFFEHLEQLDRAHRQSQRAKQNDEASTDASSAHKSSRSRASSRRRLRAHTGDEDAGITRSRKLIRRHSEHHHTVPRSTPRSKSRSRQDLIAEEMPRSTSSKHTHSRTQRALKRHNSANALNGSNTRTLSQSQRLRASLDDSASSSTEIVEIDTTTRSHKCLRTHRDVPSTLASTSKNDVRVLTQSMNMLPPQCYVHDGKYYLARPPPAPNDPLTAMLTKSAANVYADALRRDAELKLESNVADIQKSKHKRTNKATSNVDSAAPSKKHKKARSAANTLSADPPLFAAPWTNFATPVSGYGTAPPYVNQSPVPMYIDPHNGAAAFAARTEASRINPFDGRMQFNAATTTASTNLPYVPQTQPFMPYGMPYTNAPTWTASQVREQQIRDSRERIRQLETALGHTQGRGF